MYVVSYILLLLRNQRADERFGDPPLKVDPGAFSGQRQGLLLLSCAKSHMLSASRRQPRLLHVSAVDRRQTWSMDKS